MPCWSTGGNAPTVDAPGVPVDALGAAADGVGADGVGAEGVADGVGAGADRAPGGPPDAAAPAPPALGRARRGLAFDGPEQPATSTATRIANATITRIPRTAGIMSDAVQREGLAFPGPVRWKRGDMRWFRRTPAEGPVELDPARQEALVQEIRHGFGQHVRVPFHQQVDALVPRFEGDDGLYVAIRIVWAIADEAHASIQAQVAELNRMGRSYPLDRRYYRALWQQAGRELSYPLFALRSGFHPYIHLPAALATIGANAARTLKLADPAAVLSRMFEVVELVMVGWESGLVRVDTDAAYLMSRLISAARDVRVAVGDEPPPLPPAMRELMRRNRTTPVYDQGGTSVVGGINVGAEMRPAFLV